MKELGKPPIQFRADQESLTGFPAADVPGQPASAPAGRPGLSASPAQEPFDRVTRLAAMVVGTPFASVAIVGEPRSFCRAWIDTRAQADRQGLAEPLLRQQVVESGEMLLIDDIRPQPRRRTGRRTAAQITVAWAGVPVRGKDGRVLGALCVADHLPRRWSDYDVEVLEALAQVAAGEAALQSALKQGGEDGAWSPNRSQPDIPRIPGLQVAARCMAGRAGADLLGIFCDIFPSVGGRWGLVVGEVRDQSSATAKSSELARCTLRAEALKAARPSAILAGLNQVVLHWPAADRLLTATCATVRPSLGGAIVQVSAAGLTRALLRRADGGVQAIGRQGTLLGLRRDPDLHDSRRLLRAGDSLILVSGSVTGAAGLVGAAPFGDDRLRQVVAGLGTVSAARTADAVLRAALSCGEGQAGNESVALVLKVPGNRPGSGAHAAAWPGTHAYPTLGGRDARRYRSRRRALCVLTPDGRSRRAITPTSQPMLP